MDSDSEDESFVTIGTPLPPFEDDEAPKKPQNVQDQTVRDNRGRQRFHGAFTGGFSAGYFNTVGSKDGWTPSVFTSSKAEKQKTEENRLGQRPEDFMDDEDLKDHGIAPRQIDTTDDFGTAERKRKHISLSGDDGIISSASILTNLVVPHKSSVGIRLLRKLGWKEGQGIGPRVKKTVKKTSAAEGGKVYGCAARPPINEEESEDDDIHAEGFTFAPKDVNPVDLTPKDNLHGLGYSGINPRSALGQHINLFDPVFEKSSGPRQTSHKITQKKGMRGKAFGVGALEDDDDDIYSLDHMSNYDRVIEEEDKRNQTHGWTAPKHTDGKQLAIMGHVTKCIEGFQISSTPLKAKKVYAPPQLPQNFKPYHQKKSSQALVPVISPAMPSPAMPMKTALQDANTRSQIMGEEADKRSIFDLVSDEAKARIKAAKEKPPPEVSSTAALSTDNQVTSTNDNTTHMTSVFHVGKAFSPFEKNPAKQARYEKYVELKKLGKPYELGEEYGTYTTWEREREAEEFSRAAKLYRPLSSMMASRFTRAKYDDDTEKEQVPPEQNNLTDHEKAAQTKMFGRLTRDVFEWHPDNTVCKRFNVPNPYPGSTIVGLPKVKRDKFSVFNFLGLQAQDETPPPTAPPPEPQTTPDITTGRRGRIKPLALVSDIDFKKSKKPPETGAKSSESGADEKTQTVSNMQDESTLSNLSDDKKGNETIEERPPMDLFKAIFSSSDSESSSEDEDAQDEIKNMKDNREEAMITEPSITTPKLRTSRWGSANEESTTREPQDMMTENMEEVTTHHTHDNSTVVVETLEQRLSPSADKDCAPPNSSHFPVQIQEDAYAPALPPALTGYTESSGASQIASSSKHHRKKKHKQKQKKKLKYKKKKLKKSKHKKRKKKETITIHSSTSSSNDADTESEDDQELNKKLADRLMALSRSSAPRPLPNFT